MSAELSRTSLAVVLGSAGTIQRTSLAVVLTDPELLPPEPEPESSTRASHPPLRPFAPFAVFAIGYAAGTYTYIAPETPACALLTEDGAALVTVDGYYLCPES